MNKNNKNKSEGLVFTKLPDGSLKKLADQTAFDMLVQQCKDIIKKYTITEKERKDKSGIFNDGRTLLVFKDQKKKVFNGFVQFDEDDASEDVSPLYQEYNVFIDYGKKRSGDYAILLLTFEEQIDKYRVVKISRSPEELEKIFEDIKSYFKKE